MHLVERPALSAHHPTLRLIISQIKNFVNKAVTLRQPNIHNQSSLSRAMLRSKFECRKDDVGLYAMGNDGQLSMSRNFLNVPSRGAIGNQPPHAGCPLPTLTFISFYVIIISTVGQQHGCRSCVQVKGERRPNRTTGLPKGTHITLT